MYNSRITYIRIQEIADLRGTSIAEINKKCGISKNTISQSANTGEGMKAKKLFDIATVLDCSVDYLLGRTESPELNHSASITVSGNNQTSTNGNNNISISETEKLDEMSSELLKKFSELSFDEKIEVFNYIGNIKVK